MRAEELHSESKILNDTISGSYRKLRLESESFKAWRLRREELFGSAANSVATFSPPVTMSQKSTYQSTFTQVFFEHTIHEEHHANSLSGTHTEVSSAMPSPYQSSTQAISTATTTRTIRSKTFPT